MEWFSGYCDADGTISRNGKNQALQISSIHKEFLINIKLMLQTCGINSIVSLNMNERKLSDRGCTLDDVKAALESNKKFKMEDNGINSVVLNLVDEEADAPAVIVVRNKVLKTTVKGVPDIARVTIVKQNDEYVIQTTGSNLAKVLDVEGLDKNNVRTNNVSEIAETLGIEAARNALINELSNAKEEECESCAI